MKKPYRYICFVCLLLGFVQVSEAQYGRRRTSVYSTLVFQTWKLEGKDATRRLNQIALPLFITRPISSRLNLFISESNAISSLNPSDESDRPDDIDLRLSGIGDTKIKAVYSLVPKKLQLTGGVSLPTGNSSLNQGETRVLREFNSETLGFRVRRLGEGAAINIGLAGIQAVGPVTVGLGGGYFVRGAYDNLDTEGDSSYNPGNHLNAVLGIDWRIQRFSFRNGLTLTTYTSDKLNDVERFRQGPETIIENIVGYRGTRFSATAYLRNTIRAKNELADAEGEELIEEEKNLQGGRVVAALFANYRLNIKSTVKGLIESRHRLKNDMDEDGASILSIGGGFRRQLRPEIALEFGIKLSRGDMENGEVDLSGLTLSSALISKF